MCVLSLMLKFKMELEFENQLNHYVEFGDKVKFWFFRYVFMFRRASGMLSILISMTFDFMYV